jgi:aminotransferase
MNYYQQCNSCVLDTTDPDIIFDSAGVCNYCKSYRDTKLQFEKVTTTSHMTEKVLTIKADGRSKQYDAIVGVSGGVDSTYALYLAVKKLGLRVLALHVDGGWDSEIAVGNIHRAIEILGVDLYTEVIDWEDMRNLQAAFFRASVVNCDIPQDHAFRAIQYKIAKKLKIHHFISGRNFNTDAMMPEAWVWPNHDSYHIKSVYKRNGTTPLKSYPFFSIPYYYLWLRYIERYEDFRVLEYVGYKRNEAKKYIGKELGWRDYGGKHYESVFTEFYQSFYLPQKFGFDKRKAHLSGLILNGEMNREEAIRELEEPACQADRVEELTTYFLKKIGFSRQEWDEIMKSPNRSHAEYPNAEWILELLRHSKKIVNSFKSQ